MCARVKETHRAKEPHRMLFYIRSDKIDFIGVFLAADRVLMRLTEIRVFLTIAEQFLFSIKINSFSLLITQLNYVLSLFVVVHSL